MSPHDAIERHLAAVEAAVSSLPSFPHHKHLPDKVVAADKPELLAVLSDQGPWKPWCPQCCRLMRVNIDETSPDFLQAQNINLQGIVSAPYGYFDMAVLKGAHNYLAVTASQSNLPSRTIGQDNRGQTTIF